MNKRFLLVSVLAFALVLAVSAFMATSAQAAEPNAKSSPAGVDQADAPPDPEWEAMLEMQRQRLQKLQAEWDAMMDANRGSSRKEFDVFMVQFFRKHNIRMRYSELYFARRDARWANRNEAANQGQGGAQQGQAQTGTQQGGTQQGGTQQGQGQGGGTQQGQNQGGLPWQETWDPTRFQAHLGRARCSEILADGHPMLNNFARHNGAVYADVADQLCSGTRFSDLRTGYWISRKAGIPANVIFSQRNSGMGWQEILTAYDLQLDTRSFTRR